MTFANRKFYNSSFLRGTNRSTAAFLRPEILDFQQKKLPCSCFITIKYERKKFPQFHIWKQQKQAFASTSGPCGSKSRNRRTGAAGKKPVRKEKKLETTEKSADLTDAHRPKRNSVSGGAHLRFGGNATEFRAERVRQIRKKFRRIRVFFAALPCAVLPLLVDELEARGIIQFPGARLYFK